MNFGDWKQWAAIGDLVDWSMALGLASPRWCCWC